jgi:enoyl-CoA hydratase/carnithine racemase
MSVSAVGPNVPAWRFHAYPAAWIAYLRLDRVAEERSEIDMAGLLQTSEAVDSVVTLTLDRPDKKNALSVELRDEVSETLDRLAADDDVSVVVVTGSGDSFCSGFDLGEFQIDDAVFQTRLWESSDRFHRTCLGFPLPMIAAVNGAALAGGFDLAVMCDIRVVATTAWFAHPELNFTETVYGPLHDLVGGGVARELALTGRRVDPDEAKRIGLANAVVPAGDVLAEAHKTARQIAATPRTVLARMKQKIIGRAGLATGPTLDL